MSQVILAVYENGVFRPLEQLHLAEQQQVRLTVESTAPEGEDPLAGLRLSTGISDLAENFDDYRLGNFQRIGTLNRLALRFW